MFNNIFKKKSSPVNVSTDLDSQIVMMVKVSVQKDNPKLFHIKIEEVGEELEQNDIKEIRYRISRFLQSIERQHEERVLAKRLPDE
jgi:hypothetical protein